LSVLLIAIVLKLTDANSSRWDPEGQRAFYNGLKSIHSVKHQTMDYGNQISMNACEMGKLDRIWRQRLQGL